MQAGLIVYLEGQLHGSALEEGHQTYPAHLILLTSLIGLTLISKAQEGGLVGRPTAGVICSIYIAKLSLLILPQVCLLIVACGLWLFITVLLSRADVVSLLGSYAHLILLTLFLSLHQQAEDGEIIGRSFAGFICSIYIVKRPRLILVQGLSLGSGL